MPHPTILIADDHSVVLEGLRKILEEAEFEVIGRAVNGEDLVRQALDLEPDVIVTDISMPQLDGRQAVEQIRQHRPRQKAVFLTVHRDAAYAAEVMTRPGSAYVLKQSAATELVIAVRETLAGRTYVTREIPEAVVRSIRERSRNPRFQGLRLTPRQQQVLMLLAQGRSVKDAAQFLNVSRRTIEFHKYRLMDLVGVRTVAELARYAVSHGMA